jgi:ribose-phosphate pyrophosphokinase
MFRKSVARNLAICLGGTSVYNCYNKDDFINVKNAMTSSNNNLNYSNRLLLPTRFYSFSDSNKQALDTAVLHTQPSFSATQNLRKNTPRKKEITLESFALIGGTGNKKLVEEISSIIGTKIVDSSINRFADGEVSIQIHENVRGKDVYVVQSCGSPVNDNIMELLLTVSAVRRSGARRVTAVIPYFAYKHHRRGSPISTKYQTRFLSSNAMDFAKMLQEMGVDKVISVDLQRPGQGKEACFFDNQVTLETIVTTEYFVDYLVQTIFPERSHNIVVVAPNAESVKKSRNFQLGLQKYLGFDRVKLTAFFSPDTSSGPTDTEKLEMLGLSSHQINGADVVIVDDMIDTGGTVVSLSKKLKDNGARNIYVCASHGLFTADSSEKIDNSHITKVIVTNTLPKKNNSDKIVQISVAQLVSNVMTAEHFRTVYSTDSSNEEFSLE